MDRTTIAIGDEFKLFKFMFAQIAAVRNDGEVERLLTGLALVFDTQSESAVAVDDSQRAVE